jgi:hypothetical protein
MCLKYFFKNTLGGKRILPYIICSHCSHDSSDVVTLKCGHMICKECLCIVNVMTNNEKNWCIICTRNNVRNMGN